MLPMPANLAELSPPIPPVPVHTTTDTDKRSSPSPCSSEGSGVFPPEGDGEGDLDVAWRSATALGKVVERCALSDEMVCGAAERIVGVLVGRLERACLGSEAVPVCTVLLEKAAALIAPIRELQAHQKNESETDIAEGILLTVSEITSSLAKLRAGGVRDVARNGKVIDRIVEVDPRHVCFGGGGDVPTVLLPCAVCGKIGAKDLVTQCLVFPHSQRGVVAHEGCLI